MSVCSAQVVPHFTELVSLQTEAIEYKLLNKLRVIAAMKGGDATRVLNAVVQTSLAVFARSERVCSHVFELFPIGNTYGKHRRRRRGHVPVHVAYCLDWLTCLGRADSSVWVAQPLASSLGCRPHGATPLPFSTVQASAASSPFPTQANSQIVNLQRALLSTPSPSHDRSIDSRAPSTKSSAPAP